MLTVFLAALTLLASEAPSQPNSTANNPSANSQNSPATNSAFATMPSTAVETQMLIEKTKQEIAQEEKAWTEEVNREKASVISRQKRFSDFSQDRIKLQQSIADQEAKLKTTLAKMDAHQIKEKELQAHFKQLAQVIGVKAKDLREAMAKGIPYRMDKRLEALDVLIRDIAGANISPEEGLNRLWTVEQNERRMAQDAEVYTGDFNEDGGEAVQVKYLRIGKQILAFSSLDGSRLGILKPTNKGYIWYREKEMDHATRQALKLAISTAEGKAIPGFVPVPIWKVAFK